MSAALELAHEIPQRALCTAAGISRSTLRRRLNGTPERLPSVISRRRSRRALSEHEQAEVLAVLHGERFADRAPATIHATLLDEGIYLCSVSTMYRLLRANAEVRERRRIARHPEYRKPELVATGPRQVFSWDITKLRGPHPGEWFSLLVMLDIFSRFVVGWMLVHRANAELARHFIAQTLEREGIQPGHAIVHADRGAEMTAQPVCALMDKLGVVRSHSRPHVSDDNPFSESQFRTLKYHPEFPDRFGSFEHGHDFVGEFMTWYNNEHRHSGIAMLTPAMVHHGQADRVLAARHDVMLAAYRAKPERFIGGSPKRIVLPPAVWINPPAHDGVAV
ncbi:IS3 family transposase [Vulcanimicrobium alpinum]|uniref:IS3 family transposase n=1 Tax=Vulcanimicrobium alpinum TaxID=3016050 RepID=A0AAN1XWY0_UNVUL|nr:IS3 family transposase [Vulcanimicrobium alpinum]BDE04907.1 IS3 family transposase [Vulcanimicrobium alpinum]BDE06157.1 IS3 family transposase [Vulcanimicrobium alpinum]BDE06497.1 IS3 family transposase [Vulcanimicrobium alpinum]BDE06859.1 IS3 family transposase [Vulcanimicrobium alpinum]BDE07949.1 IS3 family transposase [Vulcanimicrobium alpinum]